MDKLTFVILAGIVAAILVLALVIRLADSTFRDMPTCQEDEVIIGAGDFNGRRWEDYRCIPLDDLTLSPGISPLPARWIASSVNPSTSVWWWTSHMLRTRLLVFSTC